MPIRAVEVGDRIEADNAPLTITCSCRYVPDWETEDQVGKDMAFLPDTHFLQDIRGMRISKRPVACQGQRRLEAQTAKSGRNAAYLNAEEHYLRTHHAR